LAPSMRGLSFCFAKRLGELNSLRHGVRRATSLKEGGEALCLKLVASGEEAGEGFVGFLVGKQGGEAFVHCQSLQA